MHEWIAEAGVGSNNIMFASQMIGRRCSGLLRKRLKPADVTLMILLFNQDR